VPYTLEFEEECKCSPFPPNWPSVAEMVLFMAWCAIVTNLFAVLSSLLVLDDVPLEAMMHHARSLRYTYTTPFGCLFIGLLIFNSCAWLLDVALPSGLRSVRNRARHRPLRILPPLRADRVYARKARVAQRAVSRSADSDGASRWGSAWFSTWADALPDEAHCREAARELAKAAAVD